MHFSCTAKYDAYSGFRISWRLLAIPKAIFMGKIEAGRVVKLWIKENSNYTSGTVTIKLLPFPNTLSAFIFPLCASTMVFT